MRKKEEYKNTGKLEEWIEELNEKSDKDGMISGDIVNDFVNENHIDIEGLDLLNAALHEHLFRRH